MVSPCPQVFSAGTNRRVVVNSIDDVVFETAPETGPDAGEVRIRGTRSSTCRTAPATRFTPNPGAVVVDADMTHLLSPGDLEAAIANHPAVYDVVVVGRPSVRWGNEVVALVQLAHGESPDSTAIVAEAARHVARYKLPKEVLFGDRIQRSPSGKPHYRWAKAGCEIAVRSG